MERAYSHSRPPTFSSKNNPPTLFSSSSSSSSFHNNNGGFFTTSYDDVFGGPPKFASSSLAPRAEDYSEIFGCFRSSSSSSLRASSSIPVLDLPAIPDDVYSAAAFCDYSEVFGGFNAADFAVPFDQLFRPCHGSFCDADADASSDEAWTPAGSESLSDDSDPFAFSEKSQCFSSENYHQPSVSKQLNVSYNKVNLGTSTYMPNTTHVAQLNDEPGYTCVVDEATSLREVGKETVSPVDDNNHFRVASPSDVSPKHARTNMSHASCDSTVLKSYNSDCRSDKASNSIMSQMKPAFASVTDINLRTEPSHLPPASRMPPVVADRNGGFEEHNSCFVASEKCGLEPIVDDSLPSFFDMEMDASSSAAASAAAMKDVMDRAQEKFRAAKESRDRKDRVQNSGKLHLETNINGGENVQGPCDDSLHGDIKAHTATDRGSIKVKYSTNARHARKASLDLLDILAGEHPNSVSEKPADTKQWKKSSMSADTIFTDAAGQWKEARQYYEFVNNDTSGVTTQPPSNNDNSKTADKQKGGDDDDSDSACVTTENRRRLKATKAVSRQGYYEKMVKVAQEVHDNVIYGHVEPEKRLKCMSQGYPGKQKPEFVYEPERNEVPLCKAQNVEVRNQSETIWKGETEMRSKNVLEKEESKSEAFHIEAVAQNAEIPYDSMFKEASEVRDGETFVRGKHDQRVKEHCQKLRIESRVAELPEQKRNKETRQVVDKEPCEGVLGDRMQTALETEKKDNAKELLQKKAADKRLKEAFEDGFGMERLQRACETIENDKMQNLLQKTCDYENYHEEAVVGHGSMKMFEKNAELEKSEIEASEHVRGMVYEASSRTVDNKNSKGQKQNEIKKKSTDVEHKSLHEPEQENTMKSYEDTVDKEDQKGAYKSRIKIEGEDEDPVLDSSADRVPIEDGYVELKISSELKKPKKTADIFTKVTAKKLFFEISTTPSEEISNFEAVTTADVVNAESQIDPTVQVGPIDIDEHEERSVRASGEVEDNNTKIGSDCTRNEQTLKEEKRKAAQIDSDPNMLKDLNVEIGGKRDLLKDDQVPVDHANKVGPTHAEEIDGFTEHSSKEEVVYSVKIASDYTRNKQILKEEKRKTVQLDSDPNMLKDLNVEIGRERHLMRDDQISDDHVNKVGPTHAEEMDGFTEHSSKEEAVHSLLPEEKETFQNIPHQPNLSQSIERKGKTIDRILSSEEKDEEKERNLETERLRKIEEERERLREREKDRMAVELAVREARDRAFADARDRAERAALEKATDEARQRAMAEARERLEKACAEARERSSADKTSEARSRAERAAVERANSEARQRAIEKAKADRVTFEARERMQRSVSEKYTSERDVIMRQSSFPTSSERFDTAYGEPAQRCKARLERHRRTVERVANALAEKNMRDNLAQREQAERTRFAETLDADIRRWSSGKEGNLRALLSTLQYILGPDSGWHPIPLTEVITAAAVKKAYRKATLCVHPDKLQQRGATIQQKYICEKVFDLLKEAWNRFSSEEK